MKEYDKYLRINKEDYLVVKELEFEGKKYIYVISENGKKVAYLEEYQENDKTMIKSVDNNILDKIKLLFANDIINNENL